MSEVEDVLNSKVKECSKVVINEGSASIEVENNENLFFNPVQVMNRDLSVTLISRFYEWRSKHFKREEPMLILEPLAATGLRSVRYAKEIDRSRVKGIVSSDLSSTATASIRHQRSRNFVSPDVLSVLCADANAIMSSFGSSMDETKDTECSNFLPTVPSKANEEIKSDVERIRSWISSGSRPQVIDLDPFGSVAPFVDSAVQAIANGGLIVATSTDSAVLCGNNSEVSFYKYGGTALKTPYMHEMSLRLLLHTFQAAAAKYRRYVVPLCSFSIDFYVRVFLFVFDSTNACKRVASETSLVAQCVRCENYKVTPFGRLEKRKRKRQEKESETSDGKKSKQKDPAGVEEQKANEDLTERGNGIIKNLKETQLSFYTSRFPDSGMCSECGASMTIGGPFYNGPLHSETFLKESLANFPPFPSETLEMHQRVKSLLTVALEELPSPALFLHLPSLCRQFKVSSMNRGILENAIKTLGFKISAFHRDPQAIKTDAPICVVFDIVRKWATLYPPKFDHPFLTKEIKTEGIVIDESVKRAVDGTPRWLPNPRSHWGPGKKGAISANEAPPAELEKSSEIK